MLFFVILAVLIDREYKVMKLSAIGEREGDAETVNN